MKKVILSLILSGLVIGSAQAQSTFPALGQTFQMPAQWTLETAVEYARKNNPQIHIALQRMESAAAMVDSARSGNKPAVSVAAEYSQTNAPLYSFGNILNQGAFDNSINFNNPGRTDDLLLQAKIEYRVYDGGETKAGIQRAQSHSQAASHDLEVIHQQLAFEVVKTFHTILQAKDMLNVREAAIQAITASVAVGRARYEAGDLLKEDMLNLELQHARAVEDRIRTRHELELSKRIFWNLLGIQSDPAVSLPEYTDEQRLPANIVCSNRKELQTIDAQIAAAEADLDRARSGELPTVDSFAHYQLDQGSILGESGDSWLAGLRLNYNLYDGNRTRAGIAAATARLFEARSQKDKLQLALSLELQRAQISYQQSLERLQVTAKMVEVAEESASLSRIRFQEGVILASDLIDMEMRLTDARASRASAKAENRIAIANLRRATGVEQFAVDKQ
jgi:outer membrane protein TolC